MEQKQAFLLFLKNPSAKSPKPLQFFGLCGIIKGKDDGRAGARCQYMRKHGGMPTGSAAFGKESHT